MRPFRSPCCCSHQREGQFVTTIVPLALLMLKCDMFQKSHRAYACTTWKWGGVNAQWGKALTHGARGLVDNCLSVSPLGRCISYGLSDIALDQRTIYYLQWLTQWCIFILVLPLPYFIPLSLILDPWDHTPKKSLCHTFLPGHLG